MTYIGPGTQKLYRAGVGDAGPLTYGYWQLGEASGTRVDATGRGNDLTPTATPGNAAGIIGNAVALNGSSQYLSRASNSDLTAGDVDVFCWAWVYLTSNLSTSKTIMGKLADLAVGSTMEYWLGYLQSTDRLAFFVSDGTNRPGVSANALGSPSLNTWYLVAGWRDKAAQTINIAINGDYANRNTASFTAALNSTASSFSIGYDGNSRYWQGRIDEAGLQKAVPSAAYLAYLYNGGAGVTYPL